MNKKQLSVILEIINEPMHGIEFYDRNTLSVLLHQVDIIASNMEIDDNTSQEKVVQIVNNYIKSNVRFRREYLNNFFGEADSFDKGELVYRTAYAALIQKEAVCSGYAEAMRILLAYYGIESKTIITKLPRRLGNPACHYLTAAFLDDGSIKLLDPERENYCERKGYDFQNYLNNLEFAIPNEDLSKNKLVNDGIGIYASEYLARDDVKKAKGIENISRLLKAERNYKDFCD